MNSKHISRKFGHLTVTGIAETYRTKSGAFVQKAQTRCDCGAERVVHISSLTAGQTTACKKCSQVSRGHSPQHQLKSCWRGMIARCHDQTSKQFFNYGGRGITVCPRWRESFENFLEDLGPRPAGTSLDRINNNGNYEINNCRWATPQEQQNNKRNNKLVTMSGQTLTLTEWSRKLKQSVPRLEYPLRHGFTLEQIIEAYITYNGAGNLKWRKERKRRTPS